MWQSQISQDGSCREMPAMPQRAAPGAEQDELGELPFPCTDPSAQSQSPWAGGLRELPRAGTRRAQEGAAPAKGTRCHSHFHPAQIGCCLPRKTSSLSLDLQGRRAWCQQCCREPRVALEQGGGDHGRAPQKLLSPLPAPSSPLCSTWVCLGVLPPPCSNSWWSRA